MYGDYLDLGSYVAVAVFDDGLEVRSTGKLPHAVTTESLSNPHKSALRNPLIAEAFRRTGGVKTWGRGTNRILPEWERHGAGPPILEKASDDIFETFRAEIPVAPQATPQGSPAGCGAPPGRRASERSEPPARGRLDRGPRTLPHGALGAPAGRWLDRNDHPGDKRARASATERWPLERRFSGRSREPTGPRRLPCVLRVFLGLPALRLFLRTRPARIVESIGPEWQRQRPDDAATISSEPSKTLLRRAYSTATGRTGTSSSSSRRSGRKSSRSSIRIGQAGGGVARDPHRVLLREVGRDLRLEREFRDARRAALLRLDSSPAGNGNRAGGAVRMLTSWMEKDDYGYCHRLEWEAVKVLDRAALVPSSGPSESDRSSGRSKPMRIAARSRSSRRSTKRDGPGHLRGALRGGRRAGTGRLRCADVYLRRYAAARGRPCMAGSRTSSGVWRPSLEIVRLECSRDARVHFNLIRLETGMNADVYPVARDDLHHWRRGATVPAWTKSGSAYQL